MAAELPVVLRGRDRTKTAFASVKQSARSTGTAIASALGGAVVVGAVVGLTKKVLALGDAVAKDARSARISSDEYQRLSAVFEETGAGATNIVKTMAAVTKAVFDAGRGSTTYVDSLKAINLSHADLVKFSPEQQLYKILDGIRNLDDESKKLAVSQNLLGRASKQLGTLLDLGADGAEKIADEYERAGLILSPDTLSRIEEANDSLTRLGRGVQVGFAEGIAAGLPKLDDATKKAEQFRDVFYAIGRTVADIFNLIQKILPATTDANTELVKAQDRIIEDTLERNRETSRSPGRFGFTPESDDEVTTRLLDSDSEEGRALQRLFDVRKDLVEKIDALSTKTVDAADSADQAQPTGDGGAIDPAGDINIETKRLRAGFEAIRKSLLTEVERINADYEDAADTINRNLGANLITLEEANEQEARAKSKQNDRLAEIEQRRNDGLQDAIDRRSELAETEAERRRDELDALTALVDRYDRAGAETRGLEADIVALTGLREHYAALGEDVTDVSVALANANERLREISGEAVEAGAEGGGLSDSFGTLFGGIAGRIQDAAYGQDIADVLGNDVLAALSDPEKRKAIFDSVGELLSGIASLFKGEGGDGIGGALSGIFGGLFGGGREHGGSVDSGKVYVVGERGPELYSPGRDGSIIPNSALGGDTFHMTFAMDRMDDRNFVATFAKNAPKIVEGIAHQMTRQGVRRK